MACFADHAHAVNTTIVENVEIAKDTIRLRIHAPELIEEVVPGQFYMVRNTAGNDPLIGRAFALYDKADDGSGWLDVVYVVKGKFTNSICDLPAGSPISLWGPLGNGFQAQPSEHLIMVAGGIGQTPFLTLAREALGTQRFGERPNGYAKRVTFCYGARNSAYLAGVEQFREAGCDVRVATDDGSAGHHGRVGDLLEKLLQEESTPARIVCCGPEPMMEAVAAIAAREQQACEVSLETPMACGIGICFTCVAKVRDESDDAEWDYKRTCVEGPVFDAQKIIWD